jgi:hypothetical protein
LPDLAGNDGKVLGLNSGTPQWVDQTGGGNSAYMFPDYANMETIKQISANNGTWEVDRDGYVFGYGYNETGNFDILVDGVAAAHFGSYGASSWGATVQVTKGSKVQIKSTGSNVLNIACYFIPPKYSTPPTPIVVEGGDYSTSEQAVMVNDGGNLRAKLDTDGDAIYERTFKGNITMTTAGTLVTTELIPASPGIKNVIKTEGYWEYIDGQPSARRTTDSNNSTIFMAIIKGNGGELTMYTQSEYVRTKRGYVVTVQYPKTTD